MLLKFIQTVSEKKYCLFRLREFRLSPQSLALSPFLS